VDFGANGALLERNAAGGRSLSSRLDRMLGGCPHIGSKRNNIRRDIYKLAGYQQTLLKFLLTAINGQQ
jgi:hypothetical protein